MLVYIVINEINDKKYIGSTSKSLDCRKRYHIYDVKRGSQKPFHRAIRKYGIENFKWEILVDNIQNKEDMLQQEYYYISKYNTYVSGYNATYGYDNTTLGYKFTDEQKIKLGDRSGENNPNYGNKWTDEQKNNLSVKMKKIIEEKNELGFINPSKRDDIRKKLSDSKIGDKNPNSKKWKVITPNNEVIIFTGGLKRFLKENNVNYEMLRKKGTHKGWMLEEIRND